MEVRGCLSAEKMTEQTYSITSLTLASEGHFFSVYLHSMFEQVGVVLGRCLQQRKHHVLQIAFQSILQSCIQRL